MTRPAEHAQTTGASPISAVPPPAQYRWKPGESGNPKGRPKGRNLTEAILARLDQEHNGRPLVEILADRVIKEALSGKFPFAKELWDRIEGKVTDKHEIEGPRVVVEHKVVVGDCWEKA